MSSDLESLEVVPDDATIIKALRNAVKNLSEGSSVNDVRTETEEQLGLEHGFLKSEGWKVRSKEIIHKALEEQPSSQGSPPKKASKAKAPMPKAAPKASKPQKRTASESELSDAPSSDEKLSGTEPESPKPIKRKAAPKKAPIVQSGSEDEKAETKQGGAEVNADSESELSEVLDEPPPKKRRQKSATADTKVKAKPTKVSKASPTTAKEVGPDEAEIKRLQGWLVKCGIRKLWHKELAAYDTPKSKVKHLKDMLKDAGMDGRYSVEKAKAIKEARELAADLEAVQEGEKKWGHGDDDEGEEEDASVARPKRRVAAASRFVDFGDSGEDSD